MADEKRIMNVLGLTGSIAMGKTTVARQFAVCGAKICSSDTLVHALLAPGGAAEAEVKAHFPQAVRNGRIDRTLLGDIAFNDGAALAELERILHPSVQQAQKKFIARARQLGTPLAVLEIPLLFETGAEARCDAVAVVTAPVFIQRQRVAGRGLPSARLQAILARQLHDREKRRRADFVIHTGLSEAYSFRQVKAIMREMMECAR